MTSRVWNRMVDKHPVVIARCTGVADVITAVTFAREQDVLIAIRGGGHNVAGLAMCDGGLVIDLSELRSVHVDPERQTARVDPTETAFTDRDSPFMISIDSTWTDPDEDDANVGWTQELWEAMAPYATERTYFNFDMNEEGEDVTRATFGENHERLVAVKNRYDPENRFRVNQNIQPTV